MFEILLTWFANLMLPKDCDFNFTTQICHFIVFNFFSLLFSRRLQHSLAVVVRFHIINNLLQRQFC